MKSKIHKKQKGNFKSLSKKSIIFLTTLFSTFTILPQESNKEIVTIGNGKTVKQERKTSDYEAISVSGSFNVNLISGTEGEITLEGEENILESVIVEVKENNLNIHFKKGSYNVSGEIKVIVPVKEINTLLLSGSGNINSQTELKSSNFNVAQSGSGKIILKLETNNLNTKLSGSGRMILDGTAENSNISLSGSGSIIAENLISQNAECALSGSGNITINTKNSLKAAISGSGNIKYVKEPKHLDDVVNGSGRVYKI